MFDLLTTQLIQEVPELPGLDRSRLPEDLTATFASIVSFRVRLGQTTRALPDELQAQLDQFRRLAATLETMVVLVPDRENRVATAFVAAHAHHLLYLAREITSPGTARRAPLRPEAISPEISAMLLFLIANQPTDAMDIAKAVEQSRPQGRSIEALLIDALVALATGRLTTIPDLLTEITDIAQDDLYDAAASALYRQLLEGLALLARYLVGSDPLETARNDALTAFSRVQTLAIQEQPWPVANGEEPALLPARTVFAGPHHLSLLLSAAADYLGDVTLAAVPPPKGSDGESWRKLVAKIISVRPFLWPNHLEAIEKGFLDAGISAVASFPTGSGKTAMSELKIAAILAAGGAAIYLAPTHALVAQTKASLREMFPTVAVRDSLLSDDFYAEVDEDLSASSGQIAVMTPERCLALLSIDGANFSAVRLIVFDECHLIHPKYGGNNRRSLDAMLNILYLTNACPQSDWLLMSAMMSNADELAEWLAQLIGRTCLSLNLNWKPTRQARGCLVYAQKDLAIIENRLRSAQQEQRKRDGTLPTKPDKGVLRQMSALPRCLFCLKQTWQSIAVKDYKLLPLLDSPVPLSVSRRNDKRRWYLTPNKNEVAAYLAAQCVRIGMKVLLFTQDTRFAMSIADNINSLLNEKLNQDTLSEHCKKLVSLVLDEAGSKDATLLPRGRAACHHGLMLPAEREVTEDLFRKPLGVDAIAATPTLAQGMNFPADIVFVVGDERFDSSSQESTPLEAHEILNAAGRAGRAGHVAQGVVVILPHLLVTYDTANNTVDQAWLRLQQAVFSLGDQCLPLRDPIGYILDLLHDAKNASDPDVTYFLRRLPPSSPGEPDAPRKFLQSTLAAFHAKLRGESAQFDSLVAETLQRKAELSATPTAETWRDRIAYRTGVSRELIESLHEALILAVNDLSRDTKAWIKWFFDWLGEDNHAIALLGYRLPPDLRQSDQKEFFGGKLSEIIWAWMCGETLLQLEVRLGGKSDNPGRCMRARRFILRLVPELAFAIGLVTLVRRRQIQEQQAGQMPISLATVGWCVREGVSRPELLALQVLLKNTPMSRQKLQLLWTVVDPYTHSGTETESFGQTKRRVSTGLSLWVESRKEQNDTEHAINEEI